MRTALFAVIGLIAGACAILPALFIPTSGGGANGWLVGGIFFMIAGVVTVLVWAKAIVILLAAGALGRRTNHMLCTVGACISLMNLPLGTALGVFALTVLQRPQVKASFSS